MDTTARRPTGRARRLVRRWAAGGALVAAAVGVGFTAAPAGALPRDPCAIARAHFNSYMSDARFWLGAMDQFESWGDEENANAAAAEADYYLNLASGQMAVMESVC